MKKILNILIALFAITQLHAQLDLRATCKSSGLKIQAFAKSSTAPVPFPAGSNTLAMIVCFSLPANGATNTSTAPVPVSITNPFGLTMLSYPVAVVNDRFIYTYYNNPASVTNQTDWATNSEHLLLELTFTSVVAGKFPRLDNLLNSGPHPTDYWYFELNSIQRSDTEGTPFYNGALGAYGSGDAYVQALTPLPVTLVSFNAEKFQDRSSHLTWATSSEINSDHFVIQRSTDKKSWVDAGTVKAAANSQLIENYEFVDYNVYNGRDSRLTVFYRLQMVDIDSQTKTSPIESVVFGSGIAPGRDFVVYPNPASDGVQVEWDANRIDQPTSLEFFDIQGKLVYTQKVSENTDQQYIDFGHTNIAPGIYLLRMMNGVEPIDFKQIVVGQR